MHQIFCLFLLPHRTTSHSHFSYRPRVAQSNSRIWKSSRDVARIKGGNSAQLRYSSLFVAKLSCALEDARAVWPHIFSVELLHGWPARQTESPKLCPEREGGEAMFADAVKVRCFLPAMLTECGSFSRRRPCKVLALQGRYCG